MCDLAAELRRCEADTARLLNKGAAARLAGWQKYEADEGELIAFVQRCLRGPHKKNGGSFTVRAAGA